MVKKTFLAVMAMMSIMALSACNSGNTEDGSQDVSSTDRLTAEAAQQVLNDSFSKMADLNSYEFDGLLALELVGGLVPLNASLTMAGEGDVSNPVMPKLNLNIGGKVSMGGDADMTGQLDVRLLDNTAYLMVSNLENLDSVVPAEMVAMFSDQWWSIALDDVMEDVNVELEVDDDVVADVEIEANDDIADLDTEQVEAVKQLIRDASLFTNVEDVSTEKGVYHFTGDLDQEGLKSFIVAYGELVGEVVTQEELTEMDNVLANSDIAVQVWIDSKSGDLKRFVVDALVTIPEEERTSDDPNAVKVTADVTYSNFNKVVTVEVPEDAMPLQ
ncbi:hypothetical protein CVV38_01270 [Candidatus Peregrinibacteria bacterium HGW-Peregrinibacteria-1]|jgi:hypothetical protein|nr:MAG: hypothetical protein CVV38_01270 [Candidatus Peregrinibacteria bacterium HGW-Peregrinibacteria-1]